MIAIAKEVELTILIPSFNEGSLVEKTVLRAFKELRTVTRSHEILVIDDSTDGTVDILFRLASKPTRELRIIHRENVRGVGSAIRCGIEKARGKYVIVFMADVPQDARYFNRIVGELRRGNQLASTSRFLPGCRIYGYPLIKRVGNLLCNNAIRIAFLAPKLRDFSTLFKGFDRKSILELQLEAEGYDVGAEIEMKAIRRGYNIVEVPIDWVDRSTGSSKLILSRQAPLYVKRLWRTWLTFR